MSSNIDKLTNTFCDQLTNLTSIVKHIVNFEQTTRGSSSTSSKEQSLVGKTRHKETRKGYHQDSDDSDDNDTPTHKSPSVNFHHRCVQSSTAPKNRDDDKVSIPDGEEMNRALKPLR